MSFRVLSLADTETVPVLAGELQWIPLRRRLGVKAFGTNAYRAACAGDLVVEDHVELPGTSTWGRTALEDGTIVLGVGGWAGKPYEPRPWEPIFPPRAAAARLLVTLAG